MKSDEESVANRRANHRVVKSWSTVNRIVEDLDSLAHEISSESGVHCDRSKILNALAELALDAKTKIDGARVIDATTLKDTLGAALGVKKRR